MSGLWPREHGAYAQLVFPLVTGLVYAGGHPGAVALAVAAVAVFLSHEPLAVIMGTRGVRLRDLLVGAARRRLWVLAGLAVAALVVAAAVAPVRAWQAAVVPGLMALALLPFFFAERVKTLAGELLVAATFSAMLLPLAMSERSEWAGAWVATAVWFGVFALSIVAVHAVKASHKGRLRARWLVPAAPLSGVVVGVLAVVGGVVLPEPARSHAVLPPVLAVVVVGMIRPHPRHLKRIGWTMVAAYTATLFLLLV